MEQSREKKVDVGPLRAKVALGIDIGNKLLAIEDKKKRREWRVRFEQLRNDMEEDCDSE